MVLEFYLEGFAAGEGEDVGVGGDLFARGSIALEAGLDDAGVFLWIAKLVEELTVGRVR